MEKDTKKSYWGRNEEIKNQVIDFDPANKPFGRYMVILHSNTIKDSYSTEKQQQ